MSDGSGVAYDVVEAGKCEVEWLSGLREGRMMQVVCVDVTKHQQSRTSVVYLPLFFPNIYLQLGTTGHWCPWLCFLSALPFALPGRRS